MALSDSIKRNGNEQGKPLFRISILNDLYVDLFGSLVPGLLTVILGSAMILLALSTIHVAFFHQPLAQDVYSGALKEVLTALHWEIATVIIVSSFVIGAVFFRQDPKKPDAASALHVWMNSKRGERSGLAVQSTKQLPNNLILSSEEEKPSFTQQVISYLCTKFYIRKLGLDTQFPYLHLRCYLAARGLTHLIRFVPWCPQDEESKGFRTKMFINIMKVRILSLYPDMSRDIIRNEAHVRLATSVWYATTTLRNLSLIVLGVLVLASTSCIRNGLGSTLFNSSTFALLLLLFCTAMRHDLRKCIHYMRVREVIYVLEAANLAELISTKGLFSDLIIKDQSNKCVQCDQVKPAMPASPGA